MFVILVPEPLPALLQGVPVGRARRSYDERRFEESQRMDDIRIFQGKLQSDTGTQGVS
ncbi:protein of unknown function [Methanoculleus bourgensis]|uniref:Uncharacterized protein n=1 Tax=Methanoculleus bourgensis TaxID=83986 RepID=A0A0X3BNH1_9EURY|nr:protein of unknown function [Methanoculleus bourgensis]